MTKNKQPLIKIEYENSFSAKELAEYLVSLNDEFKSFITENNYGDLISNELSIKEIKQGSLEIYPFLEYAASTLPLLDQIQVFIDFFNHVASILTSLKKDNSNIDYSQKKLATYKGLNGINVAGDNNKINYMVINVSKPEDSQTLASFNNTDAKQIDENIKKRLIQKKEIEQTSKKAVTFFWDSAKFDFSKPYNYKGICRVICYKPYNVIFDNDEIKNYMTTGSHLNKSWQFLTYVVDIELTKGKDKPIYKITKVYENQTFYEEN